MLFQSLDRHKTRALIAGLSTALMVGTTAYGDELQSGQTFTETFSPGSIKSFDFNIGDNASLFVGLRDGNSSNTGGSTPRVTFFDGNGTQIFQRSTTNAFNQKIMVTNGGVGRAIVESASGGEYSLQLTSIPGEQTFATGGGSLTNGTPVEGTFLRGEADTYTFLAEAGDTFFLSLRDANTSNTGGSTPRATLFQPNAVEIFEQSTTNFFVSPIIAPQSGEYSLVVATQSGGDKYTVQVSNVRKTPSFATGGGNVIDGERIEGTLARSEADTFLFAVEDNSNVFFALSDTNSSNTGGSNPIINIFDPSGTEIFTRSTTSNFTQQLMLEDGGVYTAVITGFGGNGGGYTLQFDGVIPVEDVPEPTSAALLGFAGLMAG